MKHRLFFLLAMLGCFASQAQIKLNTIKNKLTKDTTTRVVEGIKTGLPSITRGSNLSQEDIVNGLKEALTTGTEKSALKLGSMDGFFKDEVIKIMMPPEAEKVTQTLRSMGMGSMVDKAILSMNRAAEDAVSGVGNIFVDAIKSMTINDALGILRGDSIAATTYLSKSTTRQLTERFRPIIETSLKKTDATKYWNDVFTNYNKVALRKINPDLPAYVTERSLHGMFYSIGLEEQEIRKDPAARVTDLLKKVFE